MVRKVMFDNDNETMNGSLIRRGIHCAASAGLGLCLVFQANTPIQTEKLEKQHLDIASYYKIWPVPF